MRLLGHGWRAPAWSWSWTAVIPPVNKPLNLKLIVAASLIGTTIAWTTTHPIETRTCGFASLAA